MGPCPWCEEVPDYIECGEFVSLAHPCGHRVWPSITTDRIELAKAR